MISSAVADETFYEFERAERRDLRDRIDALLDQVRQLQAALEEIRLDLMDGEPGPGIPTVLHDR